MNTNESTKVMDLTANLGTKIVCSEGLREFRNSYGWFISPFILSPVVYSSAPRILSALRSFLWDFASASWAAPASTASLKDCSGACWNNYSLWLRETRLLRVPEILCILWLSCNNCVISVIIRDHIVMIVKFLDVIQGSTNEAVTIARAEESFTVVLHLIDPFH